MPKTYGYGKETVYVYYYETYKLYAKEHKVNYFPCKIGFTTTDVYKRLSEQNAAMPEEPIVPFIIKTAWGNELETLLHMAVIQKKSNRKWNEWRINGTTYASGGGSDWFLTNPREILKEAVRFKQTEKGAKEILELYNAIRTNWGSELIDRFKHYFPEIDNLTPLDLILKTDKEIEARRKKYGQYVPPPPPPPILPKANLYTDEELYDLQKNNLKEYEKLMKRYEKENPKKQPF